MDSLTSCRSREVDALGTSLTQQHKCRCHVVAVRDVRTLVLTSVSANYTRTDFTRHLTDCDLDLWSWPLIPGELHSWPTYMQKVIAKVHSVLKMEWKQTSGWTESIALPSMLMLILLLAWFLKMYTDSYLRPTDLALLYSNCAAIFLYIPVFILHILHYSILQYNYCFVFTYAVHTVWLWSDNL